MVLGIARCRSQSESGLLAPVGLVGFNLSHLVIHRLAKLLPLPAALLAIVGTTSVTRGQPAEVRERRRYQSPC